MLPQIGMPELLIVLVILMLLFGVGKLPEIGRGLGQAIREFKQVSTELSKPLTGEESNGQES